MKKQGNRKRINKRSIVFASFLLVFLFLIGVIFLIRKFTADTSLISTTYNLSAIAPNNIATIYDQNSLSLKTGQDLFAYQDGGDVNFSEITDPVMNLAFNAQGEIFLITGGSPTVAPSKIVKEDQNHTILWQKDGTAHYLVPSADGGVFTVYAANNEQTGYGSSSSLNSAVTKYDSAGNVTGNCRFNNPLQNGIAPVAVDSDGKVYLVGQSYETSAQYPSGVTLNKVYTCDITTGLFTDSGKTLPYMPKSIVYSNGLFYATENNSNLFHIYQSDFQAEIPANDLANKTITDSRIINGEVYKYMAELTDSVAGYGVSAYDSIGRFNARLNPVYTDIRSADNQIYVPEFSHWSNIGNIWTADFQRNIYRKISLPGITGTNIFRKFSPQAGIKSTIQLNHNGLNSWSPNPSTLYYRFGLIGSIPAGTYVRGRIMTWSASSCNMTSMPYFDTGFIDLAPNWFTGFPSVAKTMCGGTIYWEISSDSPTISPVINQLTIESSDLPLGDGNYGNNNQNDNSNGNNNSNNSIVNQNSNSDGNENLNANSNDDNENNNDNENENSNNDNINTNDTKINGNSNREEAANYNTNEPDENINDNLNSNEDVNSNTPISCLSSELNDPNSGVLYYP